MPPNTNITSDPRASIIADLAREYGPAAVVDELTTYMLGVSVKLARSDREDDAEEWSATADLLDDFVEDILLDLPER